MLYNEIIGYNEANITYNGTLVLNVIGLSSPIIVNNATIVFSSSEDNSNFTTMGIISYDTDPYGVMTFQVTEEQANAIIEADFIVIESSAELQFNNVTEQQVNGIIETEFIPSDGSAELQINNISNFGTLLIP